MDFTSPMRVPSRRIKVSFFFHFESLKINCFSTRLIQRMSLLRCSTSHQSTCSCKDSLTCVAFPFITSTRSRLSKKERRAERQRLLYRLYANSFSTQAVRLQEANSVMSLRFLSQGGNHFLTVKSV